jgi:cyclic-di-AMP phosphodiesterase
MYKVKKNRFSHISVDKVLLFLASVGICFGFLNYFESYAIYAIGLVLLAWLVAYIAGAYIHEKWMLVSDTVLSALKNQLATYVDTANIPMALTDKRGVIKWQNSAFTRLVNKNAYAHKITHVIKDIDKPSKDKSVMIADTKYTKEVFEHSIKVKPYFLYRLVDVKEDIMTSTIYQQYLSVVSIIQIDNYYELSSVKENLSRAEVTHSIENVLNSFAKPIKGMLKKTDRDKYILVFERKYLAGLIQSKFEILDKISNIDIDGAQPTMSIAIGVSNDLHESYISAQKALELAIGRGGNQAVIKRKDKFSFYGGPKGSIVRSSKVKSRMLSRALRNMIQQCDKVFVMGHKNPDFDCLGSAMGIVCLSRFMDKETYLVLEPPTASLDDFVENIRATKQYHDAVITSDEAVSLITPSSLVVVVDTQIAKMTASHDLVKLSENMVVIDHHLRGADNIENAVLYYHEPFASSASELVTEIVQYFDDSINLLQIEAEALLSGITVDTKNFTFKTGVRTFEAASFLRKFGADTTVIKKHFKDDFDTFVSKAEVVKKREMIHDDIAIGFCPKGTQKAKLVAAQAADTLVSINGISTSYVFSYADDDILISGRSIEGQNVQLVLERIGGGGHSTIAAVRLKGLSQDEAKQMLIKSIEKEIH